MKEANDSRGILLVLVAFLAFTVIGGVFYFVDVLLINKNLPLKECLKPLGEQICEERGLGYYTVRVDFASVYCVEDRSPEYVRLKFTPEEMEECR